MDRGKPRDRRELDHRIERVFGADDGYASASSMIAAAVVARLLPQGVIKGGAALRMRFGEAASRFTSDVDVARTGAEQDFRNAFEESLDRGWEGFSGTIEELAQHVPDGIPPAYLMHPYAVHLSYERQSWVDVRLEVTHNELGDATEAEFVRSDDLDDLFSRVGLPSPGPLPLMSLAYQIAQKIHASSEPGSLRAHDLVDLQTIVSRSDLDYEDIRDLCVRLFAYRRKQQWPPRYEVDARWSELYESAAEGLGVLPTVAEGVAWANDLVERIDWA